MEAIQTEKNSGKATLDELVFEYKNVLVDLNALIGYAGGPGKNPDYLKMASASAHFFSEYFKKEMLCVIRGISNDYRDFVNSKKGYCPLMDVLKVLIRRKGLISLTEKERNLYQSVKMEIRDSDINRELSERDFVLTVSAAVFAESRGSAAIISNNSGIRNVWQNYSLRRGIGPDKFGFFFRKNENGRNFFEMNW